MKGDPKVIELLNQQLASELQAISQYVVHASMCDNWGYQKLHDFDMGHAKDEMKHVDMLVDRILFLEGAPIMNPVPVRIGSEVPAQILNDLDGELQAISTYNMAALIAQKLGDNGSRELFESILKDEERHANELEAYKTLLSQIGPQWFMAEMID